jgi:hypothetical protein
MPSRRPEKPEPGRSLTPLALTASKPASSPATLRAAYENRMRTASLSFVDARVAPPAPLPKKRARTERRRAGLYRRSRYWRLVGFFVSLFWSGGASSHKAARGPARTATRDMARGVRPAIEIEPNRVKKDRAADNPDRRFGCSIHACSKDASQHHPPNSGLSQPLKPWRPGQIGGSSWNFEAFGSVARSLAVSCVDGHHLLRRRALRSR